MIFIRLTKFVSLHISVTTQNISLFTICNKKRKVKGALRVESELVKSYIFNRKQKHDVYFIINWDSKK